MRIARSRNQAIEGSVGYRQGISELSNIAILYAFSMLANSSVLTFAEKNLSFWDSLYLTIVTAASVGYGDYVPETVTGKITISIFIVSTTIFLLTVIAALIVDLYIVRRHLMITGKWKWKMKEHILIINGPTANAEAYYQKLGKEIRRDSKLKNMDILLATNAFPSGLPNSLTKLGFALANVPLTTLSCLDDIGVDDANYIVILAEHANNPASDSKTFDLLSKIKDRGATSKIVAEYVNDENKQRFKHEGANYLIRPIRGYPEIVTRCLADPGSEEVIEGLFVEEGHKIARFNLSISHLIWSEIICSFAKNNIGVPIAYLSTSNQVIVSPSSTQEISAKSIFILVDSNKVINKKDIQKALCHESLKID